MAKKQITRKVESEEVTPDEEPAGVVEEESNAVAESDDASGVNQTKLIHEAVRAGKVKPADGVAYIKEHHGVDINSKYFSIVKGKMGKGGEKVAAAVPRKTAPSAPTASSSNVPPSLFDDLKHLREMKDRYGDDFRKMVDAIG